MTTTKGMRHELAAFLAGQGWADVDVIPYPAAVDNLTRPAVLLAPTGRAGAGVGCPAGQLDVDVIVASPVTTPGRADDVLDDVLDLVHSALQTYRGSMLDPATRGVYLDTYPCWTLPIGIRR